MAILIVFLMMVLPFATFIVFSILAFSNPFFWFFSAGSLALFLFFLLAKFRIAVRADERLVMEWNGISRVLRPGRHWTIPVVDRKIRRIKTSIYTTELGLSGKVGFGGIIASFTGATAYLRLNGIFNTGAVDPFLVAYNDDEGRNEHAVYRATYFPDNWKETVKGILQDALTSTNIIIIGEGRILEALQRGVSVPITDISQVTAIRLKRLGFCGDITLHIII